MKTNVCYSVRLRRCEKGRRSVYMTICRETCVDNAFSLFLSVISSADAGRLLSESYFGYACSVRVEIVRVIRLKDFSERSVILAFSDVYPH